MMKKQKTNCDPLEWIAFVADTGLECVVLTRQSSLEPELQKGDGLLLVLEARQEVAPYAARCITACARYCRWRGFRELKEALEAGVFAVSKVHLGRTTPKSYSRRAVRRELGLDASG